MSEGNSKIDYTKVFAKKKLLVNKNDLISNLPDDIRNELQLGIIQPTDFGRRNKKNLLGGESNPGQPGDSRLYLTTILPKISQLYSSF